ncbi:MAG: carbohydrate kinase [Hyphomicrobiales bacterium]|nr:MAG: carbohydrate kinase [Hyphomicrobiales bacterium]
MAGELTIGIDVGTTSVKAGLLDQNGKVLDYFVQPYLTRRHDDGRVEQDANDWVDAIEAAFLKFAGAMANVAAIGMCSQVNTHVFVDTNGNPLEPAIVWQDGRASLEAQKLDTQITEAQRIAWWGAPMPIDASHALSRMLWVANNRPQVWEKTAWVMLPKDYCQLKLTGNATSDALSNIGLVDQHLRYIPEVLELVPGANERLAPLQPIKAIIGEVRSGPAKGIPIANCTMDGWTGLLGCGGYSDKTTSYLSGTSEILGINTKTIVPTPGVIVFPECEGIRLHAGPTQSGGAAKLWYGQLTSQSPQEMSAQAAASDYSRPAPIFIPHLQGERAPIWKSHTRGIFLGLDQKTNAADMARSVYEGVAFSVRQLLETLERSANLTNETITCGGGGFQSHTWNQIRANVLGRHLRRIKVKDPGILGASGIAACAVGLHTSFADAFGQITSFDAQYEPDAKAKQRYDALFQIYKDAIIANEGLNQSFLDVTSNNGVAN